LKTFLLVLAILLFTGCAGQKKILADLVIENVTVYSGEGRTPFVATVAVANGNIANIALPGDIAFEADRVIDGSGKFLTPGLWDVHAHTRSADDPAAGLAVDRFIEAGVTSINDIGGYPDRIQALLDRLENRMLAGPTVYPVFFMLNGESFAAFQREVTTKDQVMEAVDELVSLGARQVKIHRAFPPELLAFLVDYAGEAGIPVTGHIPLGLHPLAACEAGMRNIHHIASFIESLVSVAPEREDGTRAAFEYMLSGESRPLYDCLRENEAWFAPTLVTYEAIARDRTGDSEMPQEVIEFLAANTALVGKMYEEGIQLLPGTDTSDYSENSSLVAGSALLDELELLEKAGIPAVELIRIATSNPAKAIGVYDEVGSISVGKRADLLLMSEDPGLAVAAFRTVEVVIRGGAGN
jgi:imidazolonepropionase-like amidohydrolase